MATRRAKPLSADGRLANPDPRIWLENADYRAVDAANPDPDALAALLEPNPRSRGSLTLRLGAGRHGGPAERRGYVLRQLAHQRRSAAIAEFAAEHNLDRQLAMSYFHGQGMTA